MKENKTKGEMGKEKAGILKEDTADLADFPKDQTEEEEKGDGKSFWSLFKKKDKSTNETKKETYKVGDVVDLTDDKFIKLNKEEQESFEKPTKDLEKTEKEKIRDGLLAKIEERRGSKLNPETNSFYKRINKGLDSWENFGKEEGGKGSIGFAKRWTKTAVNLVLIGAISSISVEKAAEMGISTVTALAGGSTSYIVNKLLFGLGISGLMELGGNKMSPKTKKFIQYGMLAGTIGAGVFLTGGVVVPLASASGMLVSRVLQKQYSAEKTQEARKKKMSRLLEKYNPETTNEKAEEIENKIIKEIGKWEESRKFWGKVFRGAAAIGTSIAILETSGAVQDFKGSDTNNSESTDDQISPNKPEINNEDEIKEEKLVNNDEEESSTNSQAEKDQVNKKDQIKEEDAVEEDEKENLIDSSMEKIEYKESGVEFSSKGAIQTILNLKEEIRSSYIDTEPDRIPEHIQSFLETDSKDIAIKLGFYNPENHAESAMIIKGSTLGFDENGDLVMHDIRSGEDTILIDSDTTNEWNKYEGKMFDSDNSGQQIEQRTEIEQKEPKIVNLDEQGNTIEPEAGADKISPLDVLNQTNPDVTDTPVLEDQTDAIPQFEPKITNVGEQGDESNQEINTPTPQEILKINEENIKNLFPSQELMNFWHRIENSISAERLIKSYQEDALKPEFIPLAEHLENLKEISGIQPYGVSLLHQRAESIPDFMNRAIDEAQRLGRIDEVRL